MELPSEREPAQIIPFKRRKERIEVRYLRPSDVSRMTGLSRTKVFNALYAGTLKGFQEPGENSESKRGNAWMVPIENVHKWIRGEDYEMTEADRIYVETAG